VVAPTMLPTISVVIPTYNGEAWIADALDSVFRQTHPPNEVIVVDDASSDGTTQQVTTLAIDAPVPVHLIRHETNSGSPTPTLNTGITRATGEFIAVLDQDDVFLPTKLECQARALSGDPGLSFVFSLFRRQNNYGALWDLTAARSRVRHFRRWMSSCNGFLRCEGSVALEAITRSPTHFFGGFPGFMFRRSAWERKGGLDESLVIGADFEFLCWLCTQGAVGLIPEIHYQRHEHGANISRSTGIRGHLDVIKVLLRYADTAGAPETPRVFRNAIHHHLWDIARRLASGGHRQAAREVSATVSEMVGASWQVPVQRLAIPAYVGYYRVIGRPWKITADQADEAVELAKAAAGLLA